MSQNVLMESGDQSMDLRNELFIQMEVLQGQLLENHGLLLRYPYQYIIDAKKTNALPLECVVQNNLYHYSMLDQAKQLLVYLENPKQQEVQEITMAEK